MKTTANDKAAAFLAEARPADALEAMLVEQMAAVHEAAMRCLARAAQVAADHPEIEARYLREGARLLHLFQRQTEALDRRRIKAEDRAAEHTRDETFARTDWQEDCRRARLEGKRPPKRPARGGAVWPAWGASNDEGKRVGNGLTADGVRASADLPRPANGRPN